MPTAALAIPSTSQEPLAAGSQTAPSTSSSNTGATQAGVSAQPSAPPTSAATPSLLGVPDLQAPLAPAAGSSTAAPVLSYGVGLAQAIEAIHATIELATRQGLSQARIALSPVELGEIRIHLSQGAQGMIARVTADTPAGAQALAEGHAELRQSLHSLGLTALHMDTSASDQAGTQQRDGRAHVPFTSTPTADSRRPANLDGEEDQDAPPGVISDSIASSPGLAGGALVDVLA